ncbi:hypothetical protein F4825DRAFT_456823 [Nemania diffusa]|nr:hypothetical protein F4825DRAFT_456823 [Nemania diffusa]
MSMQRNDDPTLSEHKQAKEIKENFQPVSAGTVCIFPQFVLEPKRQQSVRWKQDSDDRVDDYLLVLFEYAGKDPLKASCFGRLFVSTKCLIAFEAKIFKVDNLNSDHEWRAFTVDDEFQYGQADSKGTHRFLVLHDKEQKPYQHRFVNSRWVKAGNLSLGLLDKAGFGSRDGLDLAFEQGRNYFGDYLYDFNG